MSNKVETTAMKQNRQRELKPALRFPEFREEPGWDARPFIDLYAFGSTNIFSRDKLNYEKGAVRNIHYGDIHTRFRALFDISREVVPFVNSTESLDKLTPDSFCTEGDIIFADASEDLADVGKSIEIVALGGNRVLSGTHTILAHRKGGHLIVGFGGYLFRSNRIRSQIRKEAQGAKVFGISSGRLSSVKVCFPKNKAEQHKIANCLTSLDDLIAAHSHKLDALKAHKKGLLQQLFPREGETLPRLRFPEFHDAPDWEETKAGTLFMNRIEEGESGLPIYSVTMNDGMVKRASLDRSFDDIAEPSGNKKAYKNDIAYNMMRMWQGAFGVAVEDCMVSPAYVVLAPQDAVYADFFGYLFKLPRCLRLLSSHSQGLTLDRLRLYYKDFSRIPLPHPPLPEQLKIADCLSSLDELITAQVQKLDALKVHKKGLMQQLFPSIEEADA